MSKPRVEIRTVTPEWALEILEKHDKKIVAGKFAQRTLNDRAVRMYATDMVAGNWSLTGQGISFDVEENLMDGQHRLAAVVKAKVPVQMIVTWDLPIENGNKFKTINMFDIGRKRSAQQQLKIDGYQYCSTIASASRLLVVIASGINEKSVVSQPQIMVVSRMMKNHYTPLIERLAIGNPPPNRFAGRVIAPLALLRVVDVDTADLFAMELNEGANLAKTSPVLQFIKFLDRPTHSKSELGMATASALASALFFYCNDKKVEHIRGNKEHLEWLLKLSKNAISKIRDLTGQTLTMEELMQHETT